MGSSGGARAQAKGDSVPTMTTRAVTIAVATLGACALLLGTATSASAHAIVDLTGKPAYAGRTSVMTLEIQHGCLQNEKGVDKAVAYFGKEFRRVSPHAVDGWRVSTKSTGDGRKVVWKLTGTRPAFNAPVYFPMQISWPQTPGAYGLPVKQWCGKATNVWDVPDGPATANQPSPPLYPLPQVQVLPRPMS